MSLINAFEFFIGSFFRPSRLIRDILYIDFNKRLGFLENFVSKTVIKDKTIIRDTRVESAEAHWRAIHN